MVVEFLKVIQLLMVQNHCQEKKKKRIVYQV